jgi:hypothetical protein
MRVKEVLQFGGNIYETALRQRMTQSGCSLNEALQKAIQEARRNGMPDQEGQIKQYKQAARSLRQKGLD